FAKGFEESLEQLHHQEALAASGGTGGVATLQYTQLEVPTAPPPPTAAPPQPMLLPPPPHIKEEPQTVPNLGGSPPVSP
ncbi:hypothetical protein ACOIDN_33400, partial [Klebsiella pneumoniae]